MPKIETTVGAHDANRPSPQDLRGLPGFPVRQEIHRLPEWAREQEQDEDQGGARPCLMSETGLGLSGAYRGCKSSPPL